MIFNIWLNILSINIITHLIRFYPFFSTSRLETFFKLLRLDHTLNELPGQTPALAADPDAAALEDAGDLAELGYKVDGSQILVIAREDEIFLGIVELDVPLSIVERNLGANRRRLRQINLLGVLVLGILEEGEEGMLANLARHLLAPPELGVLDCLVENIVLELLELLKELVGGGLSVFIIGEVK